MDPATQKQIIAIEKTIRKYQRKIEEAKKSKVLCEQAKRSEAVNSMNIVLDSLEERIRILRQEIARLVAGGEPSNVLKRMRHGRW